MKILVSRYYEVEIPGDPRNHKVSEADKTRVAEIMEAAKRDGVKIDFGPNFFRNMCDYLTVKADMGNFTDIVKQEGSHGIDADSGSEMWG